MWKAIGIVALVLGLVITYFVVQELTVVRIPISRTGGKLPVNYWPKSALFFSLMLSGILAREAYNSLVNKKPFNWTSLAIAALVAPIVFCGIFDKFENLLVEVPTIAVAFQNGFFWNSVFEGLGK
jgi:hypothetical protein